ncbi:AMP-binding protein [Actinocrispum sp. NPDC049592]|uniref:AMP-binding protein n=1 Tax=Actinocrispum sp. NPDC049592 TaxID=3154835 RepID=UPI00343D0FA8
MTNARRRPAAPALAWRGDTVGYGELLRMAGDARARIASLGLAEGAPVGVLAPKSPAAIALILACLLEHRPFLLPSVDLAERTLERLFEVAGCQAVLTADDPIGQASVLTSPRSRPEAITFMLTTSGSTGLPKVVPLTEGAVDRFTDWAGEAFGLGPDSAVLNFSPLNFDLCLLDVWATLKHGGCVVLVDPDRATSSGYLRSLLAEHGVTVVQAVPMFYQLIAGATDKAFPRVEHVVITGDSIAERCLAAIPGLFPRARLYNLYGCTETNDSLIHELDPAALPQGSVPLGEPLPGVDALVVDAGGAVLTGPGDGELFVHTPFQTTGYAPPTPNDRFTAHPAGAGDHTYFRTGDLVRREPDGSLMLLGRNDFHVKVRGVRTNLQEVERVLAGHDGIAEVAVVAVPDPIGGHRLHAELRRAQGEAGGAVNSLLLKEFCAGSLPRTAIPSTIRITDEPLPRTSTGKPDRQLLIRANTQKG